MVSWPGEIAASFAGPTYIDTNIRSTDKGVDVPHPKQTKDNNIITFKHPK